MKCPYCNGEIGLEDAVCPYCGKPNEEARRHFEAMAEYKARYAETESDVTAAAHHYAQIVPRLTVILFLIVATVVMAVVRENAWGFPEEARRRAAERNPEAVISELDSCLEKGDYIAFASHTEYIDLRTYDTPFEKYSRVIWCAREYRDIVNDLETLFLHGDEDDWIRYSANDDILRFCNRIDSFMQDYESALDRVEDPDMMAYADDMLGRIEDMLRVYFGIDDTESFLSMSAARKAAYIEEVIFRE